MDYKKYAEDLEQLIMDKLLPMYLVGCRSSGVRPDQTEILKKLLEVRRKSRTNVCALLRSVDLDYGLEKTQGS